ncbi:MAG: rRNA maturation RNase YbeY [Synergistaceae bacterium]|jgi:probable rRNA maturation factor|nr:rRNA maturation RNase YbeY [Synergistaceae bacterium]
MRLRLDVVGREDSCGIDYDVLADVLGAFAGRIAPEDCRELSVALSFVSPEDIRELNVRYREVDEETDVLSFPLWEEGGRFAPPEWEELPLGDVVVSPGYISDSAGKGNMDYNSEIILVIVHGVLHLLGFDHDNDERKSGMWSAQEALLRGYFSRLPVAGEQWLCNKADAVIFEED